MMHMRPDDFYDARHWFEFHRRMAIMAAVPVATFIAVWIIADNTWPPWGAALWFFCIIVNEINMLRSVKRARELRDSLDVLESKAPSPVSRGRRNVRGNTP